MASVATATFVFPRLKRRVCRLLISGGSLLIAADDGYTLAESLEKEGIPAAVVGRATAGNDRIVWNGEERRFLGPVRMDEIHKLI